MLCQLIGKCMRMSIFEFIGLYTAFLILDLFVDGFISAKYIH